MSGAKRNEWSEANGMSEANEVKQSETNEAKRNE